MKKGLYFKFVRLLFRLFSSKKVVAQKECFDEECVLIGHHQNFYGPVSGMVYLPDTVQIWVISHLFEFKPCFKKYYEYTFVESMKMAKPLAFVLAVFPALFLPPLLRSAKSIPVYRGSRRIVETISQSVDALVAGRQILIFPDIDYKSESEEMDEIYTGFMKLGMKYKKKTSRDLAFYKIHFSRENQNIEIERAFRD